MHYGRRDDQDHAECAGLPRGVHAAENVRKTEQSHAGQHDKERAQKEQRGYDNFA
jgi:hypothetical protein